ncbi:MAG: hypothetical protein PHZ00_03180 [Candidatus Peribacteraceae bacterium]|nr:hypothetical protein [Candidatus Peribacteraceae bacterium]
MSESLEQLEQRIKTIEERNARVEAEKAWEVSVFRKATIAVMTYVVASVVLIWIGSWQPFLSALIPTIGFILSVQSLPFIKRWWISRRRT